MKKLLFLSLLSLSTWASVKDTTVVEFMDKGSKKRVSISSPDGKNASFRLPKQLNLENLLAEMGVDSAERKKAVLVIEGIGKDGKATKDTLVAVSRDGKRIKIVLSEPKHEDLPQDSTRKEGNRRYDDPNNPTASTPEREQDENEVEGVKKKEPKDGKYFKKTDFGVYLGFNNYTAGGGGTVASGQPHHLRTLGSRFVALSWRKNATISKGKNSDVAISWGPELAWYNFMFDGNDYISDNNGKASFMVAKEALEKTKLTVLHANLPILLNVGFKESKFHFGAGAYAGYRLNSYAKLKYDSGGKDKIKGSFGLEDIQYGWTVEMGRKGRSTLFIRRNLNPLFQDKLGPDVTPWTAGIRL